MHHSKPTADNEALSAQFITATLQGGPHHGQTVRVPADEWRLSFDHHGQLYTYQRFNDAPIFHHESAIVRLLGGRR